MAIEVAAWNVHNGLGDAERHERVVEQIKGLADIVVLPESCPQNCVEEVAADLQYELGSEYVVAFTPYDDEDDRQDRHGLIVLNRLLTDSTQGPVRLEARNGISVRVFDPKTEIPVHGLGLHLDDRSTELRTRQTMTAFDELGALSGEAKFMAGDFNSMPRRFLRKSLGRLLTKLPAHYPTAERPQISKKERLFNVAHRLGSMASDETLELLESSGYRNADPKHHFTWAPRRLPVRVAQLDHIMVSGDVCATFHSHEKTSLSDHSAISATIET